MLTKVNLTKSRLIYKIKCKKANDRLFITAPKPRNLKQKSILINYLRPFSGRIIYPDDFNTSGYPAPYPAFEIKCKALLCDFFKNCKIKNPDIAVITPNGLIKDKFYFDLSEYVGKIILNTKNQNNELKSALLRHSGTVLEYNSEYDEAKNSVLTLIMPAKRKNYKN